jgi:hypothetical protein
VNADAPREGLSVDDCRAILAQAVDPDAPYRIEGWILRAMADELLAYKAGTLTAQARRRRPRRASSRPLFDPATS